MRLVATAEAYKDDMVSKRKTCPGRQILGSIRAFDEVTTAAILKHSWIDGDTFWLHVEVGVSPLLQLSSLPGLSGVFVWEHRGVAQRFAAFGSI